MPDDVECLFFVAHTDNEMVDTSSYPRKRSEWHHEFAKGQKIIPADLRPPIFLRRSM
jgi:hypothetical protein